MKDTKLQMLTTKFKELKMGDDESFDSFYGKFNEIVIAKLNLSEKIEDGEKNFEVLIGELPRESHSHRGKQRFG